MPRWNCAPPASRSITSICSVCGRPLERLKASGIQARVASPRILKPTEARLIDFLSNLDCAILVRSSGLLEALRKRSHPPLSADFSLNVANSLAADAFFRPRHRAPHPHPHDLNAAQVAELARTTDAARIEAIAYQHLPVFHTEHCVFCRFLSTGTTYEDCGRPCERHRIALKDGSGHAHPVMADVGCRNTRLRRRSPTRRRAPGRVVPRRHPPFPPGILSTNHPPWWNALRRPSAVLLAARSRPPSWRPNCSAPPRA